MSGLVDAILNLSGPAAYALVGLLAFGEAAAFVGLVLPGELAVLLGGVVASSGNASLPVMIAVASVAAVAGDSVGYELGRHLGPRILAWPRFDRRFGDKVARASAYLQANGGRAVLLGRWTSVLRALVPGLAGMAEMPYRRFFVFNVTGGAIWATTFVLLGYLAGASWHTVERVTGRASLVLLGLLVAGLAVRWATKRLVARAEVVRTHLDRWAASRPARWVQARLAVPLNWAHERTTPGASRGLGWTLSVALAGGAAWLVASAVQDLFAGEELALLDRPAATWLAAHTTPPAVTIAELIARVLGPPIGVWLVAVLAGALWRVRTRSDGLRVVVAAVLAAAVATGLAVLLPTSVAGTSFPALSVTWLTAAFVVAVAGWGPADLRAAVRLSGIGVAVTVLAGVAELVAGRTALSGVVGGVGLGALIAMGGELTHRTLADDADPQISTRAA